MKMMMIMIKIPITRPFFKLGATDFAWQQFQIIITHDDNYFCDVNIEVDSDDNGDDSDDDDDEHDDEDHYHHNSANFQARSFSFCMILDLENTYFLIHFVDETLIDDE